MTEAPTSTFLSRRPAPTTNTRNESIDTLRGALLVFMAVNHVPVPDALWLFLRQPIGVVTAAEGFVFMAGLLIGLVYTRKWRREGPTYVRNLLLRRAGRIYTAHLTYVAGVFAWMGLYALTLGDGLPPLGSPWA